MGSVESVEPVATRVCTIRIWARAHRASLAGVVSPREEANDAEAHARPRPVVRMRRHGDLRPRPRSHGGSGSAAVQDASAIESSLRLDRSVRCLIQQGLNNEGFDAGAPDGLFGAADPGCHPPLAGGARIGRSPECPAATERCNRFARACFALRFGSSLGEDQDCDFGEPSTRHRLDRAARVANARRLA